MISYFILIYYFSFAIRVIALLIHLNEDTQPSDGKEWRQPRDGNLFSTSRTPKDIAGIGWFILMCVKNVLPTDLNIKRATIGLSYKYDAIFVVMKY